MILIGMPRQVRDVVYTHSLKRDALNTLTNVADVTQDHANPRAMDRTIARSVFPGTAFHLATTLANAAMFLLNALRPQADYFANLAFNTDPQHSRWRGSVAGRLILR
jgi:hypothetical protein